MPIKSLFDLATMAAIKHIACLESVGDFLNYDAVRSILLKVDNAPQLRQIELNSPQLQGETAEIWIKLIEKDFPLEHKAAAYKPQSPTKWHRVWEKYKKEQVAAIRESENKLKNALANLQQDKEKNTSKIIERNYLPRIQNSKSRRTAPATVSFNAGSRNKTPTGASVMRKVRKERKEIATIRGNLAQQIIRGPARQTGLNRAPTTMLEDQRRAAQPQLRTRAKAPESLSAIEQYEKGASFISDSDEDDDDVFGETMKASPAKKLNVPTAASAAQSPSGPISTAAQISLLKKKPAASHVSTPVKRVVQRSLHTTSNPPTTPKKHREQSSEQGDLSVEASPGKHYSPVKVSSKAVAEPVAGPSSSRKVKPQGGISSCDTTSAAEKLQRPASAPRAVAAKPEEQASGPEGGTQKGADSDRCEPATVAQAKSQEGAESSCTPGELLASLTAAEPAAEPAPRPTMRKRKAVDIFMRPKRRQI